MATALIKIIVQSKTQDKVIEHILHSFFVKGVIYTLVLCLTADSRVFNNDCASLCRQLGIDGIETATIGCKLGVVANGGDDGSSLGLSAHSSSFRSH